jgi:hypothetical protein
MILYKNQLPTHFINCQVNHQKVQVGRQVYVLSDNFNAGMISL